MSFGKGGGTQTVVPTLSPAQNAMINAQTQFYTGTVGPAYQQLLQGANNLYNQTAPGYNAAAQNLGDVASQAQSTLGSTGESALRTGISGLENLFTPDYEQQQLQAALMPAQAQYAQNMANQAAQFGSAGQLGSARDALAQAQTAGQEQAAQMQAAAQVENNIATQRAQAANQLAQYGQGGIGQALGAAGQGVNAAMLPMQLYNMYGQIMGLTPGSTYSPNFAGTVGSTTNTAQNQYGINLIPKM